MSQSQNPEVGEKKAIIIFPPFVYSATCGPHLAPALLSGILNHNNINTQAYDLNIRIFHKLLSTEILDIISKDVLTNNDGFSLSDQAIIKWAQCNNYTSISEWPYQSLRRVLRIVRKALFRNPLVINDIFIKDKRTSSGLVYDFYKKFITSLPISDNTVIGISVAFGEQIVEALNIARIIREEKDAIPILLGGSQINLFHSGQIEQIAKYSLFDDIIIGNSENEIESIFSQACRKKITNIHHCKTIVSDDISGLPKPIFNKEDIKLYLGNLNMPVLATKGCYWGKCTFCDYSKMNQFCKPKYITRPESEVYDEILYLQNTYKPSKIMLISDGLSPAWYKKLCRLAISDRQKLLTWSYVLHSKILDNEFFALLHKAGVSSANFGTESTCDRILMLMNKMARREDIINNIKLAKNNNIDTVVNIIIDFPTMTFQEAKEVAEDIIDLKENITVLNPQIFDLTVDTDISNKPDKYGIITEQSGFEKSSHGYHSISFSRKTGMTEFERWIMTSVFNKLAGEFRVRQRTIKNSKDKREISSFFIDRSAIMYRDDIENEWIVELVSLRQNWVINESERQIYQWLLSNSKLWINVESFEKVWEHMGMSENYSCSTREWISNIVKLGLIKELKREELS